MRDLADASVRGEVLADHPLRRLRIHTPDLILRLPTDAEIWDLAARSVGRIITAGKEHYLGPWASVGSPRYELDFWRYHVDALSQITADRWTLNFCAYSALDDDGLAIGQTSLSGEDFLIAKTVSTGSWLLPEYRGSGLGKQLRAGVLALAFDEFGAERARTTHAADNDAGIGVSRSLGYRPDGSDEVVLAGALRRVDRWVLPRSEWRRPHAYLIEALPSFGFIDIAD